MRRACVAAHGAAFVLFDGTNVYKLSDQKTPDKFAGQKVRVTGTVDAKTKTIQRGVDIRRKITGAFAPVLVCLTLAIALADASLWKCHGDACSPVPALPSQPVLAETFMEVLADRPPTRRP